MLLAVAAVALLVLRRSIVPTLLAAGALGAVAGLLGRRSPASGSAIASASLRVCAAS